MPKKKHIDLSCFGVGNCVAISTFYTPQVAVGEKKLFAGQSDLPFQRLGGPAVTVAGHTTDREPRIDIRQRFSVLDQIAQMNDLVRVVAVNGHVHPGHGPVGVGKHENFQICHLTILAAYTGMKSNRE